MPVYRRRFKRKRRGTSLALRAYKMAKRVQPEVRLREFGFSEVARLGSLNSGTTISTTNPLIALGQGVTNDDRTGHVVNVNGLQYELDFSLVDATGTRAFMGSQVWTRILVMQVHDFGENGLLTMPEVLETDVAAADGDTECIFSNYMSSKVFQEGQARRRRFTVLYDKKFQLYDHTGREVH